MITPQTSPQSSRGQVGRWLRACALAVLGMLAPFVCAQNAPTGTVTGTVLDSSTSKYLEGAEIFIESQGVQLRTSSARGGSFSLFNVPPGTQTLVVSYPGLDSKSETINVVAGSSVTAAVSLSSEMIMLETMTVSSPKEGMAQAQALQRVSVQTKLVAASDQFGEVSEGNIGEYLKFLPGVSVDYNVNDARGISLRGLSTAFTIVAVDGTPMAGTSSMDDTRRFEFEQIAMNNVETTELYKTVTPDIPASSTGGFVNFVTKSAFDTEGVQRFSYNVSLSVPSTNVSFEKEGGVWGHNKEYTIRPSVEMNYARRITPKLGFNVNYRLSEKYDDSPRTIAAWNVQTNVTPTIFAGPEPRLGTLAIRSEQKLTHREAFAAKLDYKLTDATKLSVSGQWNWYDLNFTQRGPTFALGTNATATNGVYTSGTGSGVTANAGTITNSTLYRNKYGTTYHSNATLTHEFTPFSKISVTGYYSRANGQYRDTSKGFISAGATMVPTASTYSNIVISNIGTDLPTVGFIRGAASPGFTLDDIRSLSTYSLAGATNTTNFQSRPWTAYDTKVGANSFYSHDFNQFNVPIKIQAGIAYDDVTRFIRRLDLRGVFAPVTGPAIAALADTGYNKDVAYGFGNYQALDPFKVWQSLGSNLIAVSADDVREIGEENIAEYIRVDATIAADLLLTGGLRAETHKSGAWAQSRANARSKRTEVDLEYTELYPSLSAKYTPRFNRNLVFRAGASRTVGHPDYADILPTVLGETGVNLRDGTINVPDPDLKPYFSTNYDLSVDYYFKHSGVVSIYGYRKDVKNYFISRSMTAPERDALAAEYGFNPVEFSSGSGAITTNGGKSTLQGIELSYAQNLSFLPKPFNGLSVQTNFTYLDVTAKDPNPLRALDLEYSQARAVSPKTANFILGYRYGDFSFTSTTNWVSESLFGGFVATSFFTGAAGTATTAETRLARYRDEKITTDMKVEYAINKNVAVYLLVRNVFNSQRVDYYRGYLPQYQNVVLADTRYEFGEPHLTLGVRGRF